MQDMGRGMYWKHFSSMHFFLFLPEDFNHHLVLPPKFAKYMAAKLPEKVSLIGPSAVVWDIELNKNDSIEFGGAGWIKFVKAYDLQENSLLIFTYKQNSSFEVLIFDPESFCEKAANYFVKQCEHGKAEHENGKKRTLNKAFSMETIEDEDSDSSHHNDSEFVVSKKSRNDVAEGPERRKNPRNPRKFMLARALPVRGRGKRMPGPSESQSKSKTQSEKKREEDGAVHEVVEKDSRENGAAEKQSYVSEREQNTQENGGSVLETAYSHKSTNKKGGPKKGVLPKSSRKMEPHSEKEHEGNGLAHNVLEQEPEGNGAGQEQSHVSEREQNTLENSGNALEAAHSEKYTENRGGQKKQTPTTSLRKLVLQSDSVEKKYSRAYKSNRRPVTEIEKENAFKRALATFQGLNEKNFIAIMRPSAVHRRFYLNIPAGWMKQHLLHRNCQVMLRVQEKTWLAVFHCNSRKEGGLSGYGWKKFALDNFLEESDVCLFKLATQEDVPGIIVDVEIFRVVAEIVPPTPVGRSMSTLA